MALQPERFTQSTVTSTTRELLPHVFTLTMQAWRFIFCGTFCVKDTLRFQRFGALRCPDFPLPKERQIGSQCKTIG